MMQAMRSISRATTVVGLILAGLAVDVLAKKAPEQAAPTPAELFAIYLVEGNVDVRDLAKNRLAAEPLVTLADVIGYRWEGHILCLTPAAAARVAAIREWKSFIVVADGRRCYRGVFYRRTVSWGSTIPVILYPQLESVFTGPGEDERQPRPPGCFQILEHLGGSDDERARDVRNHFAVRRVMAAAGRLLDEAGLARLAANGPAQEVSNEAAGAARSMVSSQRAFDTAAPEQAAPTPAELFAIYLVEGKVDARDLANNRLAAEPLVTLADVTSYRWERHVLCLTPAAAERVAAIRDRRSFVVMADGRRCYRGAFWPADDSDGNPSPTILYPQPGYVLTESGWDETQPRPPGCFQILEHVGGPDDDPARDVRNQPAVWRVMAAAGRLLD